MEYFYQISDKNGFIHSIDNVIFCYLLKKYNMERVATELIDIRNSYGSKGWEKLNCSASSKYSWYQNTVHINSIHISFGKYSEFDKVKRSWNVLPVLRLEVNPNKHYCEPVFQAILLWIKKNCTDGSLTKYDYAIDIPHKLGAVKVYSSRKEPGLYKGTIYRGQRSQHGFMKIYDKSKEQGLDNPLTRIEHTLDTRRPVSLEKICIIGSAKKECDISVLSKVNQCIVALCLTLQAFGEDFEPYIADLNYRKREKINSYLYDGVYKLEYDMEIIRTLIEKVNVLFNADCEEEIEDEFNPISDLNEIPF